MLLRDKHFGQLGRLENREDYRNTNSAPQRT